MILKILIYWNKKYQTCEAIWIEKMREVAQKESHEDV